MNENSMKEKKMHCVFIACIYVHVHSIYCYEMLNADKGAEFMRMIIFNCLVH